MIAYVFIAILAALIIFNTVLNHMIRKLLITVRGTLADVKRLQALLETANKESSATLAKARAVIALRCPYAIESDDGITFCPELNKRIAMKPTVVN